MEVILSEAQTKNLYFILILTIKKYYHSESNGNNVFCVVFRKIHSTCVKPTQTYRMAKTVIWTL